MKKQIDSFKLSSSKNIKLEILLFVLIIIAVMLIGLLINLKYNQFKEENQKLFDTLNYCNKINIEIDNNNFIEINEVERCLTLLDGSKKNEVRDLMIKEIRAVKEFLILKSDIDSNFDNGVVRSDINMDDILYYDEKVQKINEKYQENLITIIEEMSNQYSKINLLNYYINSMYETEEKITFKSTLTRDDYENCLSLYNDVKQEDIRKEYFKYLNSAEQYIIKKEKDEEERRRQEEIKNAWIKLDVPYISQNLNYVYNGCEASSLLMALKYKGYLLDMDIVTYSKNMPKSDDPNTGFYLDIFGKEPRNIAHWIAPAPLVQYGISSSGNNNIIDATGYELSKLSTEIINNNPVVIYLTYDFNEPYHWSLGVPNNLHVLLLTGYNTITEQYLITDPYTRSNGTYEFIIQKDHFEYLYNAVGKRAVIVR